MKTRFIAFAAAALVASSAALAAGPAPAEKVAQPAAREHTLVEELARGAREILSAVVPEISLPKVELKLATPRGDAR